MRPLYALTPGFENLSKAKLESYRARLQYTLEELQFEAQCLNGASMEKIKKVDELRLKAPLIVHPPQKARFDAEYAEAELEKEAAIEKEQENKRKIDDIMYWLDELDPWIKGMDEMVEMSGK